MINFKSLFVVQKFAYHSEKEGFYMEDFIDGNQTIDTQSTETQQTETQPIENTTQTEGQQQTPTEQMFKLKYNHEEREIPYSQAVELAQKGMNYEKAIERERQAARDSFYAEQNYEWKGKPIKTEAEYKQAIEEKQREEELIANGVDPDVLEKEVKKRLAPKEEADAIKERNQKNFSEFIQWCKEEKGKEFAIEEIPISVKEAFGRGESMIDAFLRHDYKAQKEAKAKEIEAAKIQAANEKNASNSTGSVKATAPAGGDFISFDTFEQNKNDQKWIMKNFSKIQESRAKW